MHPARLAVLACICLAAARPAHAAGDCVAHVTAMTDAIVRKDFQAATVYEDSFMKLMMSPEHLQQVWSAAIDQSGAFASRDAGKIVAADADAIAVRVPLHFARGDGYLQAICKPDDGNLIGSVVLQPVAPG